MDAILVDHQARRVTIVQGKFRNGINRTGEGRNDVVGFARVASQLTTESEDQFNAFRDGLADLPKKHIGDARKAVVDDEYNLDLFFVTTGKCSEQIQRDAGRECSNTKPHLKHRPRFKLWSGSEVLDSLYYYQIGDAPAIPSISLVASAGTDVAYQHAKQGEIKSWVFMMNGREVGELLDSRGPKLFAQNIRGDLGKRTRVNSAMAETLQKNPESFFLRNNGITIVCTEASSHTRDGVSYLDAERPQIINGQQTTYALNNASASQAAKADVFVRVLAVKAGGKHDEIVSQVVEATNSQNPIKSSDLRSNDRIQVTLEKKLRKLDYFYVRKVGGGVATATFLKGMIKVPMKSLAESWMAGYDAEFLREHGSEGVFRRDHEALYKRIFERTPPDELLARWWLSKYIKQAARGVPDKAAARNIVNQLIWSEAGSLIKGRKAVTFHKACEGKGDENITKALKRLIDRAFRDADSYFKAYRGSGQDQLDAGPFFKRKGNFGPLAARKTAAFDKAVGNLAAALELQS